MSPLKPFSSNEIIEPLTLQSDLNWTGSVLEIHFVLSGPLSIITGLRSYSGEPSRVPVEGLWESTCFEAFFGVAKSTAYYEINAVPDGRWMVFRFENERVKRTAHPELRPLFFFANLQREQFEMTLHFDFSGVAEIAGMTLAATPAAVLDCGEGGRSYWSLQHSEKPDFHSPAHRLLALKPQRRKS